MLTDANLVGLDQVVPVFLQPLQSSGTCSVLPRRHPSPQMEWLPQLQLFCAAYLGVHTSGVLLTEADRMGEELVLQPDDGLQACAAGVLLCSLRGKRKCVLLTEAGRCWSLVVQTGGAAS